MRFSGIFQTISFTVRKRFVNAFLPSPYTVSKPSKNAPKTAKKIRNACGKNPHPLPPSCGSQSPKNRFVRPFFGILQVLAPKTPARWPFSHSLCVFTLLTTFIVCISKKARSVVIAVVNSPMFFRWRNPSETRLRISPIFSRSAQVTS